MDAREYRIKRIEITLAALGALIVVWGAYQGYLAYRQQAELQALRALHDAQLKTCSELAAAAAKPFSAENGAELRSSFHAFAELKHGPALVILDNDVLASAVVVHNRLLHALDLPDGADFSDQVRCTLQETPFQLALACRKMMGEAFKKEAHSAIEQLGPGYAMGWAGTCAAPLK
jgi:hypothetical protein